VKFSPIWIGVLTAVAASERNTSPLLFVNLLSPRHSSRIWGFFDRSNYRTVDRQWRK